MLPMFCLKDTSLKANTSANTFLKLLNQMLLCLRLLFKILLCHGQIFQRLIKQRLFCYGCVC